MDIGLCKPSTAILLVAIAGVIYHTATGHYASVMWWAAVGILGTGVFQGLCYGGMEPVAWVLMSIPVLIVCFFLAVALFASRMRIQNVEEVPCDSCGRPKAACGCPKPCTTCGKPKPACGCTQEGFQPCPCGCGGPKDGCKGCKFC
jgi:hypothetical protein